jgi:hypothetical protein
MNNLQSDALVFFGATGDLAYKKIFPSLQAMVERRHPQRAGCRRRQGPAGTRSASRRALDSLESTAASIAPPFDKLSSLLRMSTAITRTPPPSAPFGGNSAPPCIQRTTWPSRQCSSDLSWSNWGKRA